MKTEEIFIVSDEARRCIIPFQKEDLEKLRKYEAILDASFGGYFLDFGFWKITIKSRFFGIYKELTLEKLRMPL